MTDSQVKILAVIPTISGKSAPYYAVSDCLRDPSVRVLVVDNGSAGKQFQASALKNKTFHDRVEVVRLGVNMNWLHSNNFGATVARERKIPYVCFINDDVRLSHPFFQPMLEVYADNPDARLVVPKYNGIFGTAQIAAHGSSGKSEVASFVDGTCMLLSQQSISDIGFLDVCFEAPGWGADVDYCHRVTQAGFKTYVACGSNLEHYRVKGGLSARDIYGGEKAWIKKGLEQAKRNLAEKYGTDWRNILPLPPDAYGGG